MHKPSTIVSEPRVSFLGWVPFLVLIEGGGGGGCYGNPDKCCTFFFSLAEGVRATGGHIRGGPSGFHPT